eukprot:3941979-Rhodomonas_salina.4
MRGTDVAHASVLRACYAMSGTEELVPGTDIGCAADLMLGIDCCVPGIVVPADLSQYLGIVSAV